MSMKLETVVPFGRSLDEYRRMFGLSENDLAKKIIGVGDGPASFNAEMKSLGKKVTSVDPLYQFDAQDIEKRFYAVVDNIIAQVKATPDDWKWNYHKSPDHLRQNRVDVLNAFLTDYEIGKRESRYLVGELPRLKFKDGEFDLALCSHFLFLYSDHFSYEFHCDSIFEMLRIAKEVRIFPLLTLMLKPSPYLDSMILELRAKGFVTEISEKHYELQRGGNQMLRITR